jgi:hypothetical protein
MGGAGMAGGLSKSAGAGKRGRGEGPLAPPSLLHRLALLAILLLGSTALAKAWNGIEPGVSRREDVLRRFGPPNKTLTVTGKEVLAYTDATAIKGTSQAQFRIDPSSSLVERIDVFPNVTIDKETVENTFGPPCPKGGAPAPGTCFQKKLTDDFRTYYVYVRLGLAVFFEETEDRVQSFVYTTPKPAAATPAAAR